MTFFYNYVNIIVTVNHSRKELIMRVETKLPANEIRKICPRCNNSIVVEGVDDINVEVVYYPSLFCDFWDPPIKVPSYFCNCPVCTEKISISSTELTEQMQKQILVKTRWYYRLWKIFKNTFI